MSSLQFGMVLFPDLTHLDLAGPFEVFGRVPGATVRAVAASREPVRSDTGLLWLPDLTFDEAPAFDVICVPGGPGVNPAMEDAALLEWLGRQAAGARFVTSVCTGALVLGAAGLLRGYRATTHWMSHGLLRHFGAEPVAARVVIDRNRITGGGVTAGIDFGLTVAAELVGEAAARQIQLMLEYDPAPPFDAGSPARADQTTVAAVRAGAAPYLDRRLAIVTRAAARLGLPPVA
ncbi:MAG: DJ-1/PfpI family protein [Gemmatimonadales bacterium]|nr:DJ-1/PfpI family protein [Gemmatimonadales bacterium]